MNKVKCTFVIAFSVAVASQFHINIFLEGFIITLSVILFPIFLYNYCELNPIKTAFVTGIVSPLFRGIIVFFTIKDYERSLHMVAPDVFFYFSYGLLYYLFYYRCRKDYTGFFLSVFACDFLSNVVEISIRTRVIGIDGNMIKGLLAIALTRSLIVLTIVIALKHYKSFLIREEHEKRYRKLLLLTSSFKSEIYFMNKNIIEIEDIMKKAFRAYRIVEEQDYLEELKNLTLDISKDVHEIKKSYMKVIKGLEDISINKLDIGEMNIKDIIQIIENDVNEQIRLENLDILFQTDVKSNFYVEKHFYLVSILKNLITNSIEAMNNKKNGIISLNIFESGNYFVFEVIDNGTGIKQSNIEFIFNPGFSTKFNKDTGDISRGIGLSLVEDLVKNKFDGDIDVETKEQEYTTFKVTIPKTVFRRDVE